MNPNDSDFEEQLKTLSPTVPSNELERMIARALQGRELVPISSSTRVVRGVTSWWRGLACAGIGAAAAVAVVTHFDRTQPATTIASPALAATALPFDRAESSSEMLGAEDQGFVYEDGSIPVRQVRYSSVERFTWSNAATGAQMVVEIPREDVRLLPVAMQ